MSALDIIILIYGYAFSWIMIHLIDHGMDKRYQLMGCGIALIIAVCYLLFSTPGEFTNINYGLLTLPVIAVLTFNLAALISWKITGREFRATWSGSRYFYTEKKGWSDYLISFFVIMIELGWPIVPAVLLKR